MSFDVLILNILNILLILSKKVSLKGLVTKIEKEDR